MAIFGKKEDDKKEKTEEKTSEVKAEKKEKKTKEIEIGKITKDIILEPWVTEKSHAQMAENKYIFRVRNEADKNSVKKAVGAMYNVNVVGVNMISIPAKKRNYGRHQGTKSGFKKAIVKLKDGDKIELFKGV
jgi:large subunit ribosomal protein L23